MVLRHRFSYTFPLRVRQQLHAPPRVARRAGMAHVIGCHGYRPKEGKRAAASAPGAPSALDVPDCFFLSTLAASVGSTL
jgi:hypothetical protein